MKLEHQVSRVNNERMRLAKNAADSRDRSLPCEGHPTRHSDWSQIENQKKRGKPGFNWLRPDTLLIKLLILRINSGNWYFACLVTVTHEQVIKGPLFQLFFKRCSCLLFC